MKKLIGLFSTAALLISASISVQADIIGAKAGYEYWQTKDNDGANSVYLQLEHPIPLLPNLAVRATQLDSTRLDVNIYDLSGYYEILDNDNISLDFGAGLQRLDSGKINLEKFTDTVPMLTSDLELFPKSRFSFYARLNAGQNSETSMYDLQAGMRLRMLAGFRLQAGYREYKLDLDGTKDITREQTVRGPLLALHWDL